MLDVIYKNERYKIIGACYNVYNNLGSGFLEVVYQESLEIEFKMEKVIFVPQMELNIFYRGIQLQKTYKPDFICYNKIIVEIKAVKSISNEHKAQLMNYMKATNYKLGILVNFGTFPKLEYCRIVL